MEVLTMAQGARQTIPAIDVVASYGDDYRRISIDLEGREVEYEGDPPWPAMIYGPGTRSRQSSTGEWSLEQMPRRVVQWHRGTIRCGGMRQTVEVRWKPRADGAERLVTARGLDPEDRRQSGPQAKFLRRALRLVAQVEELGAPRRPRRSEDELRLLAAAAADAARWLHRNGHHVTKKAVAVRITAASEPPLVISETTYGDYIRRGYLTWPPRRRE